MVETIQSDNRYIVILQPNQSLSWQGNVRFMILLAIPVTIIAGFCLYMGAWLVLPFSGIELAIVFGCLYYLYTRNQEKEILTFSDDRLVLERGRFAPKEQYEYNRRWASFQVEPPQHDWEGPEVALAYKGHVQPIGHFLNRSDRFKLVKDLKQVIGSLETKS